jgi:hypothetical protein
MFPGLTTKLSESNLPLTTTIYPKTDMIIVNTTASTTVVETIVPPYGGGFGGILVIVNRSGGNITTVTTGNIATAVTIGENVAVVAVFSKIVGKFIVGALA